MNNNKLWWSSSSGCIELQITLDQASQGYHSGACDLDIAMLLQDESLWTQVSQVDPKLLSDELQEYGAWDEVERADHRANTDRLVWIACGDLVDQQFDDEVTV